MAKTTVTRNIKAPIESVFEAVSSIDKFSTIVPHIVSVEFLTDSRTGVGTRFRETRQMGKRQASTELEVTEYAPNERVRMVSDQGGTIWDSVFTTRAAEDGSVLLTLEMDARAYKFAAKLFNPLIAGMVRKAIEKDMDCVKSYCEANA